MWKRKTNLIVGDRVEIISDSTFKGEKGQTKGFTDTGMYVVKLNFRKNAVSFYPWELRKI